MRARYIVLIAILCFVIGAGTGIAIIYKIPGGFEDARKDIASLQADSGIVIGNLERIRDDGTGIRDALNRAEGLLSGGGTFSERLRALSREINDIGSRYDGYIAGLEAEIERIRIERQSHADGD